MIGIADCLWQMIIWGLESFEGGFRNLSDRFLSSLIRCTVQGIACSGESLLCRGKRFSLRREKLLLQVCRQSQILRQHFKRINLGSKFLKLLGRECAAR